MSEHEILVGDCFRKRGRAIASAWEVTAIDGNLATLTNGPRKLSRSLVALRGPKWERVEARAVARAAC